MKWPIHVTYHTSTGKTGSFVFSSGQFEDLQLDLEEDEAVWFNKDMLGFYLPLPTPEYFQDKILPKISLFSDADQFGILFMVSKTFDLASQKEVLPMFKNCKSLAVKYLSDDMSNKIQLQY